MAKRDEDFGGPAARHAPAVGSALGIAAFVMLLHEHADDQGVDSVPLFTTEKKGSTK